MSERRIKKQIYGRPQTALVKFAPGWADVTGAELGSWLTSRLHASKHEPSLELKTDYWLIESIDFRNMLELPLRLLTARDVLWVIQGGRAASIREFQDRVEKVEWDLYLAPGTAVSVRVNSFSSRMYHEGMLRDLLEARLQAEGLAVVSSDAAAVPIEVFLDNNRLTLALSLGGAPLYQRGYRASFEAKAPLAEHIAASLARWSLSWGAEVLGEPAQLSGVYVPFAGSGTLGFETMMLGLGIPPFLWGRTYAAEQLAPLPEATWRHFRELLVSELDERLDETAAVSVAMVDRNEDVVRALKTNVDGFLGAFGGDSAALPWQLSAEHGDFFSAPWPEAPSDGFLYLPLNPPYGLRLGQGEDEPGAFFGRIGRTLERRFKDAPRPVAGFCLVPDEASWRALLAAIPSYKRTTRHFTQGGRDIRVVAFAAK